MTVSMGNAGRVIAACLLVLSLLQLVVNLLLTYSGYDPKALLGWRILRKRWSSGLVVLAWLLLHSTNIHLEKQIDRGPFLILPDDLVGTWEKDDSRFRLSDDGTLEHLGTPDGGEGPLSWQLASSGDGLEIHDESGDLKGRWRIIMFHGEYRILHRYDASEWGPPADMGFSRARTARE